MDQIKNIIPQVIQQLSQDAPEAHARICEAWAQSAPRDGLRHTTIAQFTDGILTIHVDSPAWLFHMNMHKKKIVRQLQHELPEIARVIFKIGKTQ